MSTSTLALTGMISEYYSRLSCNEPTILAELRVETARLGDGEASMQIAPEQGAFMGLIAAVCGAKDILEIGTFTGYSSLAMTLASGARVTAVDVSEKWTGVAQRYWDKAGVAGRMTLDLRGGRAAIVDFIEKQRRFDLCFIDADKGNYDTYYEGALQLVRSGGLILIDNVLWNGAVADPSATDADTTALRNLNAKIQKDARVAFCIVPIGDGLTLARKL